MYRTTDMQPSNIIKFESANKTQNNLEFEIDRKSKSALISNISIEWVQSVDLALTVRNACHELEEKYGITTIIQQVVPSDLDILRNIKYFRIINYNNQHDFYNVACDIKEFPVAFMSGLGF